MTAKFLGRPAERGTQIGPAHVADEQRVSSQNGIRFLRVFLEVEHQDGNRFDRMPRSLKNLETQSRKLERAAVLHQHELVLSLGPRPQPDIRSAAVAQLKVPGDEIGMKVRQKNVPDLHFQLCSIGEVLLNVPLRVDYDCRSAGFVGDQVGRMGKTAQIILLEEHVPILKHRGETKALAGISNQAFHHAISISPMRILPVLCGAAILFATAAFTHLLIHYFEHASAQSLHSPGFLAGMAVGVVVAVLSFTGAVLLMRRGR